MTILIIEDEKQLVKLLTRALKSEGYTVDSAHDGESGYAKALKNEYDAIVLDLMLPHKGGISICGDLRKKGVHTPIIMLTARGTIDDRVIGLNSGADDYLVKPFGMNELFARIRAVLRRRKTTDSDMSKIGDLVLDRIRHEVTKSGKVVELTPKEYRILDTLITHKNEAISRKKLIESVWGPGFTEGNNELNVHIRYLRKKIESSGTRPVISTIRGVGFSIKD